MINPLLPNWTPKVQVSQNFDFKIRSDYVKNSYEHRVSESVDKKTY